MSSISIHTFGLNIADLLEEELSSRPAELQGCGPKCPDACLGPPPITTSTGQSANWTRIPRAPTDGNPSQRQWWILNGAENLSFAPAKADSEDLITLEANLLVRWNPGPVHRTGFDSNSTGDSHPSTAGGSGSISDGTSGQTTYSQGRRRTKRREAPIREATRTRDDMAKKQIEDQYGSNETYLELKTAPKQGVHLEMLVKFALFFATAQTAIMYIPNSKRPDSLFICISNPDVLRDRERRRTKAIQ